MGTGRNKGIGGGEAPAPGKVAVDSRGRNVWQWSDDQLDSTTIMLQQLENPELALEPTRKARRLKVAKAGDEARPDFKGRPKSGRSEGSVTVNVEQTFNVKMDGGFDPYNSS